MKVIRINNTSEQITFDEIQEELRNSDFHIFPKLPISDVIDPSVKNSLTKKEKNNFKTSHFDFVIVDRNHDPVFVVEFDGPDHQHREEVISRDIRKNRICQVAEIPLLRITDQHLSKVDSMSILRFIIYRFLKWKEEYPRIEKNLKKELSNMTEEEWKDVISDGFIDVGYDPDIVFDFQHPFPLKRAIIQKLEKEYNLSSAPSSQNEFWYSVFSKGNSNYYGLYTSTYAYGIYKGKINGSSFHWSEGKLQNPEANIIIENSTSLSMRWALRTVENVDINTPPIQYENMYGILPIYLPDISGARIPDICNAITEYLCYKKILDWAKLKYT